MTTETISLKKTNVMMIAIRYTKDSIAETQVVSNFLCKRPY